MSKAKTYEVKKTSLRNLSRLNSHKEHYQLDDRYLADNHGVVYRVLEDNDTTYKVVKNKPFINKDGYVEYVLTNKHGKKKHIMGEIVSAVLWIPKPKGKEFVNHKYGDRQNNYYKDLEWTTHSENIKHSYDALGRVPKNQHTSKSK